MDMALGPTSITEEREKAIDFTTPFDFEPWDIMIPAAQENIDLATFLMPFDYLVSQLSKKTGKQIINK